MSDVAGCCVKMHKIHQNEHRQDIVSLLLCITIMLKNILLKVTIQMKPLRSKCTE